MFRREGNNNRGKEGNRRTVIELEAYRAAEQLPSSEDPENKWNRRREER